MPCLNDIDERIIKKDYIFELLDFLDQDDHKALFGFYLRFVKYNVRFFKINQCVHPSLKKVLNIVLDHNWIPIYFTRLIDVIEMLDSYNFEKLVNYLCDYMSTFGQNNKIEDENKYKTLAKIMILENIKYIN
jgi:hypothetical protein